MNLSRGRAGFDSALVAAGVETIGHGDMHAREKETSLLLHAFPDLVRAGTG
jgi:creatinine amidohydrolase